MGVAAPVKPSIQGPPSPSALHDPVYVRPPTARHTFCTTHAPLHIWYLLQPVRPGWSNSSPNRLQKHELVDPSNPSNPSASSSSSSSNADSETLALLALASSVLLWPWLWFFDLGLGPDLVLLVSCSCSSSCSCIPPCVHHSSTINHRPWSPPQIDLAPNYPRAIDLPQPLYLVSLHPETYSGLSTASFWLPSVSPCVQVSHVKLSGLGILQALPHKV
ncbi:hypothetical protein B0J13DRAFT_224878 [Dactylonectria estremocensis]|uniref:Uncharacterized protein n=1 Tax=Dactylonectria estremocensis TaxID=1079267 RepID=A0A9P9F6Z4_9HYPO|nr:hypothetical protein B0J13DRAFT_224878 [Dactylonectria estremocensis]